MFGSKTKSRRWHLTVGIPLALAGIAIIKPLGLDDALLRYLNKTYELGLPLERSTGLGIFLVLLALAVIVGGERWQSRSASKEPFLALRHHSLEPFAADPTVDDLPRSFRELQIRNVNCDLSPYFKGTLCDPTGAVRLQLQKLDEFAALRRTFPNAPAAYYGLAHIPLQFLAGCALSTHAPILLFDLNRRSSKWQHLDETGPRLDLTVNTIEQPVMPQAIAIRIEISYEIDRADIQQILPQPFEEIRIGLATPRIDPVAAYSQIEEVSRRFRKVLDEIHTRVDKSKNIHVFYAGPAPLGFSLGRQISRTIHHRVLVHNYTPDSRPRYAWAVEVTSSGPPEAMVWRQEREVSK